ncbi:MAG: hypothetical protein MK365_04010 [Vicinamibacterales bacterium]|jgi:hypothetical protein|nr:hypothetical protein [Vicinamibacterales bacterium]RUA00823.1 MAG: hypothetical protein DSY84_06065 [Candidatus Neomarinimicrobiota bacterium]HIM52387.1 hypothetical protein [Acidobacteriota bacterium]HIN11505.1 hypothetical protein [Acidobacteriota bacterium]
MSLRAFHLLFIIASITLSLMMAVWGGVTYGTDRGTIWHLVTVVGALLTAGLLAVYVVKFVRKTREMGWN